VHGRDPNLVTLEVIVVMQAGHVSVHNVRDVACRWIHIVPQWLHSSDPTLSPLEVIFVIEVHDIAMVPGSSPA
jgi:hypothetical protein